MWELATSREFTRGMPRGFSNFQLAFKVNLATHDSWLATLQKSQKEKLKNATPLNVASTSANCDLFFSLL